MPTHARTTQSKRRRPHLPKPAAQREAGTQPAPRTPAATLNAPPSLGIVQRIAIVQPAHDAYEREADEAAARVLDGRSAGRLSAVTPAPPADPADAPPWRLAPTSALAVDERALRPPDAGEALPAPHRRRLERGFGVSLRHVRLHNSPAARRQAAALGARAFTHGEHIWLGPNASPHDAHLLAHETAHVVQQGAAPRDHAPPPTRPPVIQRLFGISWDDVAGVAGAVYDNTLGVVVDAAGQVLEWTGDMIWTLIEKVAPDALVSLLREIMEKGIIGFLTEKVRAVFNALFGGIEDQSGTLASLFAFFGMLFTSMQTILAGLLSGDCEPLFGAVRTLIEVVKNLASDAWDAIKDFFAPVGDFFADLWKKLGAPLVEWIGDVAGDIWDEIQQIGRDLWAWTEPVRDAVGRAWTWIKEQLGFGGTGEGESEGGLVQWITEKAGEAWDAIKETLAPVLEPIQGFIAKVQALLPLDAIQNLRDTAESFGNDAADADDGLGGPEDMTQKQDMLRERLLPAILNGMNAIVAAIGRAGAWVQSTIGDIAGTVLGMFQSMRESEWLRPLVGLLGWVEQGVQSLANWAIETVGAFFNGLTQAIQYAKGFVKPVLNMLRKLVAVVSDVIGALPDLILGPFWRLIPECVRNVVKDFVVNHILSHVPFFSALVEIKDIWGRLLGFVQRVLIKIFVDGDILGAAWLIFKELLNLVGIPADLVVNIVRNAIVAWADIVLNPVGFLINLVKAIGRGFLNFFENITTHLLQGFTTWLFGSLSEAGISPPQDLSLRSILTFVLEVLGITLDNVLERLALKIGRERVERLRRMLDVATGVWAWVRRLIEEGPAALWEFVQEKLSDLWTMVMSSAIGWITDRIIKQASLWLASLIDVSGIMPIINAIIAIYRAIQSFMAYLRDLLEIINTVFQGIANIARGVIDEGAAYVENALARALPVAIGFLANQFGFGSLGRRIAELIAAVREKVEAAIDWLIDKAIAGGRAFLDMLSRGATAVREGVAAIFEWWKTRKKFRQGDEEHTLYFEGEDENAKLMVASTPRTLSAYAGVLGEKGVDETLVKRVQKLVTEIDTLKFKLLADDRKKDKSMGKKRGEQLSQKLTELAHTLAEVNPDDETRPPSKIQYETDNLGISGNVVGKKMVAKPLSINPGGHAGSQPREKSVLWEALGKNKERRRRFFVRGHLLNHHVFGPGTNVNLTPISGQLNTTMEKQVEDKVKHLVLDKNKVVHYEVEADYGTPPEGTAVVPEEAKLAGKLTFTLREMTKKKNAKGDKPEDWEDGPKIAVPADLTHKLPT
ncbi:eCIS core domain-containing protein [Ardenticatena maritima]|uniref:Uncharacterized protein n=2 Tax=Ardenticatena maritima TaxID=872965 RepID=A0A0P6Y0H7_9CHLR|nr:DUF4157 domain-containing protein [Ardenticatena maritima]KPL89358.1 hypothetical protein SE16_02550 [Ardenticatena maritima]